MKRLVAEIEWGMDGSGASLLEAAGRLPEMLASGLDDVERETTAREAFTAGVRAYTDGAVDSLMVRREFDRWWHEQGGKGQSC